MQALLEAPWAEQAAAGAARELQPVWGLGTRGSVAGSSFTHGLGGVDKLGPLPAALTWGWAVGGSMRARLSLYLWAPHLRPAGRPELAGELQSRSAGLFGNRGHWTRRAYWAGLPAAWRGADWWRTRRCPPQILSLSRSTASPLLLLH